METITKFLVSYGIVCLIIFIIAMYFAIRSFKVVRFRRRVFDITNKAHDVDKTIIRSIEKKIMGSPSLYRMSFSFKPLKLRYWFTNEEVSLIKTLEQKLTDENEIKTNQTGKPDRSKSGLF